MTDNDRLKAWQDNGSTPGKTPPDYLNNDAAAMSLLDTLVEKGFIWSLYGKQGGCMLKVYTMPDVKYVTANEGTTRREAIVAAVLELIGKEDV